MPVLLLKRKIRKLIAITFASVFLLFFIAYFLPNIKSFSTRIFSGPVKLLSGAGDYFQSKRSLKEENSSLRKKVADLSLETEQLKDLKGENERLRALLKFQKRIDFETVSAEVIARNPNDWIGSFIINKGTKDGVRKNSAVCSSSGLLGKVVEASEDTSLVMLITHPGFRAGGMLKETRTNGIVIGSGKGKAEMLYLPADTKIERGEIVVTSGFSKIFPKGITIGEVTSIGKSKTGLYKYAVIKPSANPFDQEEVLCIK